MNCCHPVLAIDYGVDTLSGKHKIKMIPKRLDLSIEQAIVKYGDKLLKLPCGKCINCRSNKANEWAVRCYLESKYHSDNCFLTLTYDDEHCPQYVSKRDVQIFLKRLRNAGYQFRYFACGEYGSKSKRPHYHLLIFGYMPTDLISLGFSDKGHNLFTSDFLTKIWEKGFVSVGMLEPSSICYTARYNSKKLHEGLMSKEHREFLLMSRRPGLGYNYILEHLDDILENNGSLYLGDFGIKNASRYILDIISRTNLEAVEAIKEDKVALAKKLLFDSIYKSGVSNINQFMEKSLNVALENEKRLLRGF